MNLRRRKLLVEAPGSAVSDIAFTMIVFFLVCASVQPDSGKPQDIPKSESAPDQANQSQNIEVSITPQNVIVNSELIEDTKFLSKMRQLMAGKETESDRVVMVKSADEVTYDRWIDLTGEIEAAGGIVTLQLEQQQTVIVN